MKNDNFHEKIMFAIEIHDFHGILMIFHGKWTIFFSWKMMIFMKIMIFMEMMIYLKYDDFLFLGKKSQSFGQCVCSVSSDYSDGKSFCKHGNSDMFIFHVGKDMVCDE